MRGNVRSARGAGMNFFRYWSLSGRATRIQWWRFQIYAMFGYIVVLFTAIGIGDDRLRVGFVAAAVAVFLLALVAVAFKRLHDRNKSAWWLLLFYGVPVFCHGGAYLAGAAYTWYLVAPAVLINLWALIELGFLRGTRGPNRYGEDPSGAEDPGGALNSPSALPSG
jgi:uncharacterized membrane protein YhaH (DUF805 family)